TVTGVQTCALPICCGFPVDHSDPALRIPFAEHDVLPEKLAMDHSAWQGRKPIQTVFVALKPPADNLTVPGFQIRQQFLNAAHTLAMVLVVVPRKKTGGGIRQMEGGG